VTISGHRLEDSLPEQLSRFGTRVDKVGSEAIRNGGYTDIAQGLQALAPGLIVQSVFPARMRGTDRNRLCFALAS
jgi:hypothetical protein